MQKFLIVVIVVVAAAALIFAYRVMSKERAGEAEREKPVVAESKISRNADGESVVTMDEETQRRIALHIAVLAAAQLAPEVKGYGRVLDPAPLASLVAELGAARATAAASQKEWERLKILAAQSNSSARALEAGEAVAQRDQVAVDAGRQRLLAAWGKAVAGREDLTAFVQSLVSGESALGRIDLPAGEILPTPPTAVRLFALADESNPVAAEVIGPAPTVDAQTQGQGFLFLVKAGQPRFAPGAAVLGYLPMAGGAQSGVVIPREAILRFNGQPWLYLQTGAQTFTRRAIALERPLAAGWFATHGVKAGDRVVIVGAQILLSEEQKSQIRMVD